MADQAAFQANAFQLGQAGGGTPQAFQAAVAPVAVRLKLSCTPWLSLTFGITVNEVPMQTGPRGTTFVIGAEVRDPTVQPPALSDPTTLVVNVLKPDGTAYITAASLTQVSTGIWRYVVQTAGTDQVGVYPASLTATTASNTVITAYDVAFILT